MATSPNYGWLEPDNTDLVKNGALAIRTLGNAIDTTMATMTPKSIVDAKGDLIAASAADTPARLAVGNNGETLVADSSTSTGLRYIPATVMSNPVLNSCFDIWQRGTSVAVAGAANYAYSADRWVASTNYGSNITVSRQATGDTTNLPFVQYCGRVQRNSGQTSTAGIWLTQSFESTNSIPFAGKTVTFSFYARKGANFSGASDAMALALITGTGTDQSYPAGYTGTATPINTSATLTATWQRFTYTATLAATATELTTFFQYTPSGTAGANDYFELTGVQIDIGSVALPVRRNAATIQGELAACQRYYQILGGTASNFIVAGYTAASNNYRQFISFPVQMRIAPTMAVNGTWAVFNTGQPTAAFISNAGFAFTMTATATGQLFSTPDSSDDTITASAEL
jgi:hypothetical protein